MKYLKVLTHYGSGWKDFVDALMANEQFAFCITEERERFVDDYSALVDAGEVFDIIDPSAYSEEGWDEFYMDPAELMSDSMGAAYSDRWMVHVVYASSGMSAPPADSSVIAFVRDPRVSWAFVDHIGITPKMLAYAATAASKAVQATSLIVHHRVMADVTHEAERQKLEDILGFSVSLDLFPNGHGVYVTEYEAEMTSIRPYRDFVPDWETSSDEEVWDEITARAGLATLATATSETTFAEFEASREA